MILYKDKECTIPALCPMAFSNPYIVNASFNCDLCCAWCVYRENENTYMCGGSYAYQRMYAKEQQ